MMMFFIGYRQRYHFTNTNMGTCRPEKIYLGLQILNRIKIIFLALNLSSYMNRSYLKAFLLSVALTGIFFCLVILLFSALRILSFSPELLAGPTLAGFPLAILLLPFVVPTSGIFTYRFLNNSFPNNHLEKFSLSVSNLILGICVAMLFFGYQKCSP